MPKASTERMHFCAAFVALLVLALVLALLPRPNHSDLQARIQQGYALRVGYALEAPYAFLGEDSTLRGESIELLQEALAQLGVQHVRWVRLDFGALLSELEAGRIDVVAGGLFITEARRQRVRFTRPTAAVNSALLARHDAPRGERFRLLTLQGSVEARQPQRYVTGAFDLVEVADAEQALQALERGEADGLALSAPSLRWMLNQRVAEPANYRLHEVTSAEPGYPAYALALGESEFTARLDGALASLLGSARHLELVEPYGFEQPDISGALSGGRAP